MSDPDQHGASHQFAVNTLTPARLVRISNLALPMIAAALATNVMTFVDSLMVAQLGEATLGGVGLAGQLFFLLLAVSLGLSGSIQAMVARRVGEAQLAATGSVLNVGLLMSLGLGAVLTLIGYLVAQPILKFVNADAALVEQGLTYLQTRLPSLLLMSLTLTFRSYWVGVSLAKWSMVSIVALSLANILFNYALIFGHFGAPQMGVAGAGLGSTLAVAVGLLINFVLALKLAFRNGFLRALPAPATVRNIVSVASPESMRQVLFAAGVVLLYVLIGQLGTQALAGFHVIISICLIAYMPHIGIAGAATTLVGEALGRRDVLDASAWGWQISNTGLMLLGGFAVVVVVFAEGILSLFLADPTTRVLATVPLQLAVVAHVMDGYAKILAGAMIGAGATRLALQLTLLPQYLLLLPMLAGVVWLGWGLASAMAIFLLVTAITAGLFAWQWHQRQWVGVVL